MQGEDQKKLDVVSNEVFSNALRASGRTGVIASEEEDLPVSVEGTYSGAHLRSIMSDAFSHRLTYAPEISVVLYVKIGHMLHKQRTVHECASCTEQNSTSAKPEAGHDT